MNSNEPKEGSKKVSADGVSPSENAILRGENGARGAGGASGENGKMPDQRAVSSAVEHCPHTTGAAGSNPAPPMPRRRPATPPAPDRGFF